MLTEVQIQLLERHSPDFRCRHVAVSRPGGLLNQNTFYWATLKGVGKVYVQVVVDTFCSLAFGKLYTPKMPVTATDLLYDCVLPSYEALGVRVGAVLTDDGREFWGRPEIPPTGCSWPSRISNTARPRSGRPEPTTSSRE